MIRHLTITCTCAILIISQTVAAYVPSEGQSLDLKSVNVVQPVNQTFVTKENINTYIPTNLSPGNNGNLVFSQMQNGVEQRIEQKMGQKMTDYVTNYITHSDMYKTSPLVQMSNNIANNLNQVTQKSVAYTSPSGVTHKFSMAVRADQKTAVLNYEGYFNSAFTYNVAQNNMTWVVSKALDKTTTLSLTNVTATGQFAPTSTLALSKSF